MATSNGANGESKPDALEFRPSKFWKEQDFQSSARLHMQHWIWLYTLGYNLDPKIDVSKDDPIRIADIACCNGAWILDVHQEYPNATINGFDLTPAHFPAAGWLSPDISFHAWDVFTEVPDQYVGVFDVVHVRALSSAILDNKVEPVLDNLLKMLKPGGYIQWDEGDSSATRADVPSNNPKLQSVATTALVHFFHRSQQAAAHMSPEWLYTLPKTLQSRGCEVLIEQWLPAKGELQRAWCDNFLTVWHGEDVEGVVL
ncbi:hypothetical protein M409DRAFT_21724 [Zasmidium cellare ATCC 36951]|uniref:Methyltransferase domain-containing protein n=1 Tax=Zasmidium cellare ATCC 36951 TaxID=1080233 RepID=A0A6A6CS25_ZASCE|nr:uncharacterized protein M409DRAFT_21724 [Zasmidium cellare ATCC 36951]KAF2168286.1 hypothetical protein M409DRAFT_21724 [Zasmidium cellare ATCC 36951]